MELTFLVVVSHFRKSKVQWFGVVAVSVLIGRRTVPFPYVIQMTVFLNCLHWATERSYSYLNRL